MEAPEPRARAAVALRQNGIIQLGLAIMALLKEECPVKRYTTKAAGGAFPCYHSPATLPGGKDG